MMMAKSSISKSPLSLMRLRLFESLNKSYVYNEQVMIVILELGLAEKELERNGEVSYYQDIRSLLEHTFSEDIRMSICRVIIKIFNDSDQDKGVGLVANEAKLISAQQVVDPVLHCYDVGRGPLKELSIDGLYNMAVTSPQEYISVMEKGKLQKIILRNLTERKIISNDETSKGRINKFLYVPHHHLVYKSLRCLLVLIKESEIEYDPGFKKKLIEKLMMYINSFNKDSESIVYKIEGVSYMVEIREYSIKILFTMLKRDNGIIEFINQINLDFINDLCFEFKS
jgi:hypothetical protein